MTCNLYSSIEAAKEALEKLSTETKEYFERQTELINKAFMGDEQMRFKSLSIIEKYEYIEDVTSGAIEPDVTDTVKALKWLYKEYMRVLDENYSTRNLI